MPLTVRKLVVGYDGSDSGRRALRRASELAEAGAAVTVVTVRQEGAQASDEALRGDLLLAEAQELLREGGVEAELLEPVGEPADALVEAAGRISADLIIVGRHRSTLERELGESISANVIHGAPCDVLVVT